jgi:hypothetical protein
LNAVFMRHEGDKNACWKSDLRFVFYHSINFKRNIPKTSFNGTNALWHLKHKKLMLHQVSWILNPCTLRVNIYHFQELQILMVPGPPILTSSISSYFDQEFFLNVMSHCVALQVNTNMPSPPSRLQ